MHSPAAPIDQPALDNHQLGYLGQISSGLPIGPQSAVNLRSKSLRLLTQAEDEEAGFGEETPDGPFKGEEKLPLREDLGIYARLP